MLDHAFLAAVDALRRSCRDAMLDRDAGEERFQSDLLGGDLTWETSFALPGEGKPPRLRADVTLDWPTWSQTAYRTWRVEGELDEPPELGLEVVLRLQDLIEEPDLGAVRGVLDRDGPEVGGDRLRLMAPTLERLYDDELSPRGWAAEFAYDGTFELTENLLSDLGEVERVLSGFGPWLASMLVRLGDLHLAYLPPETEGR
ncbi:MAG TPA: hypothetical protein VMU14_11190 [Acidimicrobiales bacterium]|jgi:hypothetical protein|nr:hypothetical protein [Acidimicrobiales bacterium]